MITIDLGIKKEQRLKELAELKGLTVEEYAALQLDQCLKSNDIASDKKVDSKVAAQEFLNNIDQLSVKFPQDYKFNRDEIYDRD